MVSSGTLGEPPWDGSRSPLSQGPEALGRRYVRSPHVKSLARFFQLTLPGSLVVLSVLSCGGSSSETPYPLEPVPGAPDAETDAALEPTDPSTSPAPAEPPPVSSPPPRTVPEKKKSEPRLPGESLGY